MRTWAPLWSAIVDSSVWDEPDFVVKVFLTMLALKDADHIYRGTAYNLARQSRKTEVEVLEALTILAARDSKRVEPQPFDGRRIEAVEEGWFILNGEKYRSQVQLEMKRARNRKSQQTFRDRKKSKGGSARERQHELTGDDRLSQPMHDAPVAAPAPPVEHSPPNPATDSGPSI